MEKNSFKCRTTSVKSAKRWWTTWKLEHLTQTASASNKRVIRIKRNKKRRRKRTSRGAPGQQSASDIGLYRVYSLSVFRRSDLFMFFQERKLIKVQLRLLLLTSMMEVPSLCKLYIVNCGKFAMKTPRCKHRDAREPAAWKQLGRLEADAHK